MFETKQIPYFIFGLGVVAISSYFGKHVKDYFSNLENKDDYHLVKKYVLNDQSQLKKLAIQVRIELSFTQDEVPCVALLNFSFRYQYLSLH